jgi:SWI/SNF-related matrix-associated actin-dependent regulator 1 of chromatin subfamily A
VRNEAQARWEWLGGFATKDIPKQAGWRWTPAAKRWWTDDDAKAERLQEFGASDVAAHLAKREQARQEALEASRATDADIAVPVPEGRALLPFQRAGVAWALGRPATLLADEMGLGKAQPVSEPVLTPSGWRPIGEIAVGDQVIGASGMPTPVVGVFPQGSQEIYKVTFSDGASTRCTLDHLWTVRDAMGREFVLSLKQMLKDEVLPRPARTGAQSHLRSYEHACGVRDVNGARRWRIPTVKPVEFASDEWLPVDAYLLGRYRGNGRSCIPERYLRAGTAERLALLQGLLDSDGSPMQGGGVAYSSTTERLADAVVELTQSLGGIARKQGSRGTHYPYAGEIRDGRPNWRVNVKLPPEVDPFRSPRKLARWQRPTKYPPARLIDRIEPLGVTEAAVCIRVAAEDQLYVTTHYVVTHNTPQAICVINATPSVRSVLVVAPLSLKLNWTLELRRWLVHPLTMGQATAQEWPATDIVIIHPDVLTRHAEALHARQWDLVVVDECHLFKNPKAKRTVTLLGGGKEPGVTAARKLAMTGTPIPNRPVELLPILRWLDPAVPGSWRRFVTRFCAGHQTRWGWTVTGASHLDELQELLRSTLMVRRRKADVLTELPAKRRQVIILSEEEFTPEVRNALRAERAAKERIEAARREAEEMLAAAEEDTDAYAEAVAQLKEAQSLEFTEISRIRHETALAKAPLVAEHIAALLEGGVDKIGVWAHHKDVIGILANHLGAYGVVAITGDTPADERQGIVERFQADPRVRVFVGSITAAGVGVTLTAASTAVFAELDWVPGNVTQAEDRHHRIGQRDAVLIQHVLADGSIDVTLAETLIAKQEVADAALDDAVTGAPASEAPQVQMWASGAPTPMQRPLSERQERRAQVAATLTPDEVAVIHQGLRIVAGMDADYARELNGVGFSKLDAALGHDLAECSTLTPRQAALGAELVRKYRRQIAPIAPAVIECVETVLARAA